MNDKLVNWTHWYEILPGYAIKCITLGVYRNVFFQYRTKIFTDQGEIDYVKKERLKEII